MARVEEENKKAIKKRSGAFYVNAVIGGWVEELIVDAGEALRRCIRVAGITVLRLANHTLVVRAIITLGAGLRVGIDIFDFFYNSQSLSFFYFISE